MNTNRKSTDSPDFESLIGLDFQGEGKLITIASVSGMGKSSLARNLMEQLALVKRIPVGYFCFEMAQDHVNFIMLASNAGIPIDRLANGGLSDAELLDVKKRAKLLEKAPILINDNCPHTIDQICNEARKMVKKFRVKLIIVDYLSLLETTDSCKARQEQLSRIAGQLMMMTAELNISIIVLAQLDRQPDDEKRRCPRLGDLSNYGSIEEFSDVVAFLHCPDPAKEMSIDAPIKFIMAKCPGGACGEIDLLFHKDIRKFVIGKV